MSKPRTDCSQEFTNEPKCDACGVPWRFHLGMEGTCKALQDALAREANYREQIESLLKARDEANATGFRYGFELSAAAAVLQKALPIGQVKSIGLMEVAAGVGELAARLAVKCEHPDGVTCAKLWEADNARRQLESVDPKLADEFPWGCDTVEHLAVALVAARERRDELCAARDEAVADGVFWKERCDELAANLDALTGRAT